MEKAVTGIEFRPAGKEDASEILRIMSQAFERPAGSERYERDRQRITNELETHWVLLKEGATVGALHIRSEEIQVGSACVTKADVGEVCIAPAHQGRGLGTVLMQSTVARMRADGFPLSRLGGYRRFYERFGWVPFPRGSIEFPLTGLTSRGGYTDPLSYLDRPGEDAHIRPYDGKRDASACGALYTAFNAGRTGAAPVRSFGVGAENPWRVVYEAEGAVRAYVFAARSAPPYTRLSPAVSISDAACDPEDTGPLGETLRYVLRQAAIAAAESVRARLPLDPSLYDLYRDNSCGFVPSLWQSSEGGNMLQIMSLQGLLEAIAPELTARFCASRQAAGEISLRVRDETVRLVWNGREVAVHRGKGSSIGLSQEAFMKLVLGLAPVEQVVLAGGSDAAMLRAAFPTQGTATGLWG